MDRSLPRIVAGGLLLLALLGMGLTALLKLRGIDASDILTASSTATGALAGFFAGSKFNAAPSTESAPTSVSETGFVTQ